MLFSLSVSPASAWLFTDAAAAVKQTSGQTLEKAHSRASEMRQFQQMRSIITNGAAAFKTYDQTKKQSADYSGSGQLLLQGTSQMQSTLPREHNRLAVAAMVEKVPINKILNDFGNLAEADDDNRTGFDKMVEKMGGITVPAHVGATWPLMDKMRGWAWMLFAASLAGLVMYSVLSGQRFRLLYGFILPIVFVLAGLKLYEPFFRVSVSAAGAVASAFDDSSKLSSGLFFRTLEESIDGAKFGGFYPVYRAEKAKISATYKANRRLAQNGPNPNYHRLLLLDQKRNTRLVELQREYYVRAGEKPGIFSSIKNIGTVGAYVWSIGNCLFLLLIYGMGHLAFGVMSIMRYIVLSFLYIIGPFVIALAIFPALRALFKNWTIAVAAVLLWGIADKLFLSLYAVLTGLFLGNAGLGTFFIAATCSAVLTLLAIFSPALSTALTTTAAASMTIGSNK